MTMIRDSHGPQSSYPYYWPGYKLCQHYFQQEMLKQDKYDDTPTKNWHNRGLKVVFLTYK